MRRIHELLRGRFSPRKFTDEPVSRETTLRLLEAARWAPSSFNEQPWRFVVASREEPEAFERLHACLAEGNRAWAGDAAVLILSVAKRAFSRNDKPNRHAFHDVGLAVGQMIVQASHEGLAAHQMAGFDTNRARETYGIPEGFDPVAVIAIGYSDQDAPDTRTRRPLDELTFEGRWGEPY